MLPSRKLKKTIPFLVWSLLLVFVSYYLLVNTVWADMTLPNMRIGNYDISWASTSQLQTITTEIVANFPPQLEVVFEDQKFVVPLSDFEVQIQPPVTAMSYGKGADIGRVLAAAVDLVDGKQVAANYQLNLDPILQKIPVDIDAPTPLILPSGRLVGCEKNSNLTVDEARIELLVRTALESGTKLILTWEEITSTDKETKLARLCQTYTAQATEILRHLNNDLNIWTESDLADLFSYQVQESGVAWQVIDTEKLTTKITQLKPYYEVPFDEGEYEVQDNKMYVYRKASSGKSLKIQETVSAVTQWLIDLKGSLQFVYDYKVPKSDEMTLTRLDFTKVIGQGKTRLDLFRDGRPNSAIRYAMNGLYDLNGMVIQSGEEFSYIKRINPSRDERTIGGFWIGSGVCNATTTLFRAALESGLKITERSSHGHNYASYEWGYEQNMVDASYYVNPDVDLKFVNNTGSPVILKLEIVKDANNEWQYHTITVRGSSVTPERKVEIGNWKKWNIRSARVFEASFDRKVWEGDKLIIEDNFPSRYR